MTAEAQPGPDLDQLLRRCLAADDELADIVAGHLDGLAQHVTGLEFRTTRRTARTPEEEERMLRCRALRDALMALFGKPSAPARTAPPAEQAVPAARTRTSLDRTDERARYTMDEFAKSPDVLRLLGPNAIRAAKDEDRWTLFHLGLLRLPASDAELWRKRLWPQDEDHPWLTPGDGWLHLPTDLPAPLVLVPAFRSRAGIVASPQAPLNSSVQQALGNWTVRYYGIGSVASQMVWLATMDPDVWYAHDNTLVAMREMVPGYTTELETRLAKLPNAKGETAVIRAAMLADLLRSVVHQPLAAPTSWWSDARQRALKFVREMAVEHDPELVVRDLGEHPQRYRDLRPDEHEMDKDIRLPVGRPEQAGQVFDCLQPSLLRDGKVIRAGRVIYGGTETYGDA